MSAAVSAGDAAAQLRLLADDVAQNGFAEYTRDHVAAIIDGAAEALELGEPVLEVEIVLGPATNRPTLALVKP